MKRKYNSNQVRIIAGRLRGRIIHFPSNVELRPTGDQARETLFNWLMPHIQGAVCLDLFAGSGALGLEAVSRAAAQVTFVDRTPEIVQHLKNNLQLLQINNAHVFKTVVPDNPPPFAQQFDIVFIDPPFNKNLIAPVCQWLIKNNCLREGALLYIETEKELQPLPIPDNWQILKEKSTGHVRYYLVRFSG